MADGYARASGKVGVAMATSGPGATNLVTGIATAMLDSIPIVCITGNVSSKVLGTDAFQEVDITGITLPITKHNFLVTAPKTLPRPCASAFQIARSGRPGPVLVDITKDAQQARPSSTSKPPSRAPIAPTPCCASKTRPRPGRRTHPQRQAPRHPRRPRRLRVRRNGAGRTSPSARRFPSPHAARPRRFPASHPLNLGMMGMHGESWVNDAIQEADLLIACGMRFDDRVTGTLATYALKAKKIHIEIDPAEINKNVKVDVALVGDLREVLEQCCRASPGRDGSGMAQDHRQQQQGRRRRARHQEPARQRPPLRRARHARHLAHHRRQRHRRHRRGPAPDVGGAVLPPRHPRSLITSGGLGTMGFALPAAIGAKFACPEKEVWVIAGDGGFQMTAAELSTIVQEKIKINIAVINNGYLGMVRQWQEFFYERNYEATPLVSPDFVKLADAHGIPGLAVRTRAEVARAVAAARESRQAPSCSTSWSKRKSRSIP
jgi:acetolactate synthase-1/2/3 large subunit